MQTGPGALGKRRTGWEKHQERSAGSEAVHEPLPGEKKAVPGSPSSQSGRSVQTHHIREDSFSSSPSGFCPTSGTAAVCQEPTEFRGRARKVTTAEA